MTYTSTYRLERYLRGEDAVIDYLELREIDLSNQNFTGKDMHNSKLLRCDFTEAQMSGVNLQNSVLDRSLFINADLTGARLEGTSLTYTDFTGAKLSGTCMDPELEMPWFHPRIHGFQVDPSDSDYFFAFRTKRSRHIGNTVYEVGKTYEAPVFSYDYRTACHPGIYFATARWIEREYPFLPYVKVRINWKDALSVAEGKFRCRKLTVVGDYLDESC